MISSILKILSLFSRKHKAIILKLFAIFLYSWSNALSKLLTTNSYIGVEPMASSTVIFYQYLFACVLLIPYIIFTKKNIPYPKAIHLHIGRVILCCCGLVFLHDAFTYMPIAQAVGFNVISPLLTILAAYFILGERITTQRSIIIIMSIVAYICLIGKMPDYSNTSQWIHIFKPSIALLCFQINTIFTKMLTKQGEDQINLILGLFLMIPICLIPGILHTDKLYSLLQFTLILIMAVNTVFATLALNYAIELADITFLIPMGFIKYAIITTFGYVYFAETLNTNQYLGIVIGMMCLWLLKASPERLSYARS